MVEASMRGWIHKEIAQAAERDGFLYDNCLQLVALLMKTKVKYMMEDKYKQLIDENNRLKDKLKDIKKLAA
ncbi:MAG: hypothetical protein IJ184_07325 [Alphaproteobacteria bacterium]|nr:hypothetical protein [Alphaproteobacteria bacterium]